MNKLSVFIFTLILFTSITHAFASFEDQQQKRKRKIPVCGYIRDQSGNPVSGISVFVDSKRSSAISKQDGYYHLRVKPDIKVISAFSLMGGVHEVEYTGQDSIHFILGETVNSNIDFSGKKVNTGYSEVREDELTTTVGSVAIKEGVNYRNIYDMIKGEVPGVVVAGDKITIRGKSSIKQQVEPLFVLNGIIISDIDDIVPSTVKSIDILKGPSTSIYGSRGANGVILITTR